jgi:hypothetical protein
MTNTYSDKAEVVRSQSSSYTRKIARSRSSSYTREIARSPSNSSSYACDGCGKCTSLQPIEPAINVPDSNIMYILGDKHISCTECVVGCPVCMIPVSCARKEMCLICACRPVHICDIQVGQNQDHTRQIDKSTWFIPKEDCTYYPTSPLYDPFDSAFI